MSDSEETKGMKPIWHFVGLLMLAMGIIIICSGVYYVANPPKNPVALHNLHPDVWWGSLMAVFGAFLVWLNKGVTVK